MTGGCAVVSGAGGFIGTALCEQLIDRGWSVRALVRDGRGAIPAGAMPGGMRREALGDLAAAPIATLAPLLSGADVVFHLAGRAHRPRERDAGRAEALYRHDNLLAARRMAQAAVVAEVPRLVHLSSIKALADAGREAMRPDQRPAPSDAYGRSKLAAERDLRALAVDTGIGVSVVRPPLVYGPGVKGNLPLLVAALARGIPLPLARARQRRSMVGLGNLCDLLMRLAVDEREFEIYHVRDVDLDVAELVEACARLMGRRARLVPLRPSLLRGFDRLAGTQWHSRLFTPQLVDDSLTRERLAWRPPYPVERGLSDMVAPWRRRR